MGSPDSSSIGVPKAQEELLHSLMPLAAAKPSGPPLLSDASAYAMTSVVANKSYDITQSKHPPHFNLELPCPAYVRFHSCF